MSHNCFRPKKVFCRLGKVFNSYTNLLVWSTPTWPLTLSSSTPKYGGLFLPLNCNIFRLLSIFLNLIYLVLQGDWKISGFGLSTYLKQPDGQDTRWSFPDFDPRLPSHVQKNFDYIAPEYTLDEQLSPSNDMYSLGCILHFIHTKSGPPFYNNGDLDTMRRNVENMGVLRAAWGRVPDDVQGKVQPLMDSGVEIMKKLLTWAVNGWPRCALTTDHALSVNSTHGILLLGFTVL